MNEFNEAPSDKRLLIENTTPDRLKLCEMTGELFFPYSILIFAWLSLFLMKQADTSSSHTGSRA